MAGLFTQIGKNILKQLDQCGMTQTVLAERVGFSKQVINKIVLGKKAINIEEIAKIAKVLGLTVDELMKANGERHDSNSVLLMMGAVSNGNTKDELRFLNHMMDEMLYIEELVKN